MDVYNALISAGCGGTMSYIVSALHKKVSRREEMESLALAQLNEKRISTLEEDMKKHGELLSVVKSMAASIETLSSDIKQMIAADAAQSQALTNLSGYVTNLREDIGEVRRDLKEHLKEKHG